jgi:hypothetical protein
MELAEGKRLLLAEVLQRYLPALQVHLAIGKRLPPDSVEDLLQAFVADRLLEQNILQFADRSRGCKFRSFLLTSLDHFVANAQRHERTAKRAPEHADSRHIETLAACEQRDAFDVAWARQLLQQTMQQMHDECAANGRLDIWEVFNGRICRPILESLPAVSYEELGQRLDLESPSQATNLLVTAKRMFQRHLRALVAEYAGDETQIDQEIRELVWLLSRA